jgi:prevent-host-death family protein
MRVAIAEAKAQFAELVRRAEAGEAIVLTRYGRPVARLTAAEPPTGGALIGAMAGAFTVPDMSDVDAEIAAMFRQSASE